MSQIYLVLSPILTLNMETLAQVAATLRLLGFTQVHSNDGLDPQLPFLPSLLCVVL